MSQSRLKYANTYFKETERESLLQLLQSICGQAHFLLSCFHYVTLFHSRQQMSMQKQNTTGESKEPNNHEKQQNSKEELP